MNFDGVKMTEFNMNILGEDGPARKRTRFYLNLYEGHRLFGIREHYHDKKTGEMKPTRKGINLNRDTFMELKRVFDRDEDLILDWLRIGHIPEEVLRYQQLQEEAKKKNFHLVGDVEIKETNNFRDNRLFYDRHEGSKVIIEFNTAHPFAKAISEEELSKLNPKEIRGLIARLIAGYARSRTLLLASGVSEPKIIFEQNEYDWSQFSSEYISEA